MRAQRKIATLLGAFLLVASTLASARPAAASDMQITGYVADAITGAPLSGVCVTLGVPGSQCFNRTNAQGFFVWDIGDLGAPPGQTWDLYFILSGYQTAYSDKFAVSGNVRFNQTLMPTGQRELCPSADVRTPTQTVYIPNVTKTLGGPAGWQTPFIVQNTGPSEATLEVTFYRFLNGACAVRRTVSGVGIGRSFADVPNNDNDLPGDTQFSVVVRSFGGQINSVVNEQAGSGTRSEAASYVGASEGKTSVFLPNVVRRFFGYVSPIIIQNLGTSQTTATVKFTSFDGSAPDVTVTRTIPPGGSKFIDPNSDSETVGAPGLVDGKQYTATITSGQPVSVVVNTQNDAPGVAAPVAYAANGITGGAAKVYGPYAAKNAAGIGRVSTIVVQNLATAAITPTLTFTPLGGGTEQMLTAPAPIGPGQAWAFDPRFTVGTTTPCSTASSSCLGDGEYSFVANSGGATRNIAVAVNVISAATAMGYTAVRKDSDTVYLPNVTRTLGGTSGWTTPILLQAVTATSATLRWYRFSDGALVATQTMSMSSGSARRIDPRDVAELSDNTQYSVVAQSSTGTLAAIVVELASGGDTAMIYEGFAQ